MPLKQLISFLLADMLKSLYGFSPANPLVHIRYITTRVALIEIRTSWAYTLMGFSKRWFTCDSEALSVSSGVKISWFLVSLWAFLESLCAGSDDVMLCGPSFPSSGHWADSSAYFASERVVLRSHKGKTTGLYQCQCPVVGENWLQISSTQRTDGLSY